MTAAPRMGMTLKTLALAVALGLSIWLLITGLIFLLVWIFWP